LYFPAHHYGEDASWTSAFGKINGRYHKNMDNRRFTYTEKGQDYNTDAVLNGCYVALSLLYGKGELENTMKIAMQCGMATGTNTSNAAGILSTSLGKEGIPSIYLSSLDDSRSFVHMLGFTLQKVSEICIKLTEKLLAEGKGKIAEEGSSKQYQISSADIKPPALVAAHQPAPLSLNKLSLEELESVNWIPFYQLESDKFAPGWDVLNCSKLRGPGLLSTWNQKTNVLKTSMLDFHHGVKLVKPFPIEKGKVTRFQFSVANDPGDEWQLRVILSAGKHGNIVHTDVLVNDENSKGGWMEFTVELKEDRGDSKGIWLIQNNTDKTKYGDAY
jgi:hypothetical protein